MGERNSVRLLTWNSSNNFIGEGWEVASNKFKPPINFLSRRLKHGRLRAIVPPELGLVAAAIDLRRRWGLMNVREMGSCRELRA